MLFTENDLTINNLTFYLFLQILQLQMNDYKYHYLFTTFDIEGFDLEDFKYNFVNMTAFRVVNVADLSVQKVLRDMARFQSAHNALAFNSSFIEVSISICVHVVTHSQNCIKEEQFGQIYVPVFL